MAYMGKERTMGTSLLGQTISPSIKTTGINRQLKTGKETTKDRKVAISEAKIGHSESFSIIAIRSEQSEAKETLETPNEIMPSIA